MSDGLGPLISNVAIFVRSRREGSPFEEVRKKFPGIDEHDLHLAYHEAFRQVLASPPALETAPGDKSRPEMANPGQSSRTDFCSPAVGAGHPRGRFEGGADCAIVDTGPVHGDYLGPVPRTKTNEPEVNTRDENPTIEEVVFTKERVCSTAHMSGRLLHDAVVHVHPLEDLEGLLVAQMDAFLLQASVDEIPVETAVSFEVPATWWQALKEEHLPGWFKERWPVLYRTVTKTGHNTVSVVAALDGFEITKDHKIVRLAFVKDPILERSPVY